MPVYTEALLEYVKSQVIPDSSGTLWWKCQSSNSKRNLSKPVGFYDKNGYKVFTIYWNGSNVPLRCARVSFAIHNGYWPKGIIDHKNRIKDDDRPENLRDCGHKENNHNRVPTGSSKWLGVHYCKERAKFVASTSIVGKKVSLGRFNCEREAALVYNYVALKHFPECANFNQVFEDHPDALTESQKTHHKFFTGNHL